MPNHTAAAFMLDHTHCRAICDEIGERLGDVLKPEASEIPPRLLGLLDHLARLEQAPSIVPSIDEMSFPRSRQPLAPVTRSADPTPPATNRRSVSAGS
jgi:hypothetical protein